MPLAPRRIGEPKSVALDEAALLRGLGAVEASLGPQRLERLFRGGAQIDQDTSANRSVAPQPASAMHDDGPSRPDGLDDASDCDRRGVQVGQHAPIANRKPEELDAALLDLVYLGWDSQPLELDILEETDEEVDLILEDQSIEICAEISSPCAAELRRRLLAGCEGQTQAARQTVSNPRHMEGITD